MPHFVVEYTDNIKKEADIQGLLKKTNDLLILRKDIFPIGGIRSRAIECHDYYIADGKEDDAFVHATLMIREGRSETDKKETGEKLFNIIKAHFSDLFSKRNLALSFELIELEKKGSDYKWNNIHSRFKK